MKTVAVVADVHGNRWALEAVLADMRGVGVDEVVNLGDSLYGPLDPKGTAHLLRSLDIAVSVRGNQDRQILEPRHPPSPTDRFVDEALAADDRAWLAGHSATPVFHEDLFLCHGTAARDDEYLVEAVTLEGVQIKTAAQIEALLAAEISLPAGTMVLCGHSHEPRLIALSQGRCVVNPGSVGLPAYTADSPLPHAMESGSPHARYALLKRTGLEWVVTHRAVPYDWEAAANQAGVEGRHDWAGWLRTGRAQTNRRGT